MSAIILKSGLPIYFSQRSFSLDMPTTRPAQTPRLLAFKRRIKSLAFSESVALGLGGPRASNGVIFKDPLLDRMLVCLNQSSSRSFRCAGRPGWWKASLLCLRQVMVSKTTGFATSLQRFSLCTSAFTASWT